MHTIYNNLQSNKFVPKSLTTNVEAVEFTSEKLSKPTVKPTNWCGPKTYEELSNNPVLLKSQGNLPKNPQVMQMNQLEYNNAQSISNRYARPSSRPLKCDKWNPDEFLNCANINGKLYRLYNLFEDVEAGEAFKKQPKQIKRLNTGTAKPLQSRKCQNPNRFQSKLRRQPAKNAEEEIADDSVEDLHPRRCEPITNRIISEEADLNNQQHELKTEKPLRPRGRPKKNANSTLINPDYAKKNDMEMGEEQESPKTMSKKVSPRRKVDYLEDMGLGAAFRKQQQKQQLLSSRRSLGVAGPRRSPKESKNCSAGSSVVHGKKLHEPPVVLRRSARIQAAKLRKEQSLEQNLQKDQEKPNSGMVVDWKKLDKPERVPEPPIVLRRSARIQAAKLKKEALEASLRNQNQIQNQEKPSSRKAAFDHVL
ncbi:uncharacterized protein LOC120446971 isoform X2 [Drosophila santomea]|uniref:uncharacterized protein LOC120446971 isoform X2 n=1 Tax=Drosophila santomea TaxID=129105 RepID=UPI001952A988|nr:uncharacterized protein LOC120446971 isoform X2 [Drosophila santomea]